MNLVEMRNIVKRFPGVLANDQVTLRVRAGEIHGLLGENGAGKSTLMNILYGLYQPDSGEIYFAGNRVHLNAPQDALNLGIGMVHQHFMLVPRLTVLQNIILGLKSAREPWLDLRAAEQKIQAIASRYGLSVHPHARIEELSVGEQQRVEILKALYREAKLLILDEPTAVLTPQEVRSLFHTLRSLVTQGCTVIFITHKLKEVMELTDRITVLRNGRVIATVNTVDTDQTSLARMMVGREVWFHMNKPEGKKGSVALQVQDLSVQNDKGLDAVKGTSFILYQGEILGIAGVSGNGQKELLEAIAGLRRAQQGVITLHGQNITNHSPRSIIDHGVGYIPEDRLHQGLALRLSVAENLLLKRYRDPGFSGRVFLHQHQIQEVGRKLINDFDIRTPSLLTPTQQLSGGNLQKIILARELSRHPKVLIAHQPTRGLDVGSIAYIHQKLLEQRNQGKAVLLVSDDLDELLTVTDRIAVMYEGRIVRIMSTAEANPEEVGLLMAGGSVGQWAVKSG